MWLTFPYSNFRCPADPCFPNGHVAKRPALQLELVNGISRLGCFGIVDSGADHCIFPLSFAVQLGLDPLAMKGCQATGLGGVSDTLYSPITVELARGLVRLDVYAGFSSSIDAEGVGFGLLGQCGFFDRVNIVFNQRSGIFEI